MRLNRAREMSTCPTPQHPRSTQNAYPVLDLVVLLFPHIYVQTLSFPIGVDAQSEHKLLLQHREAAQC